MIDVVCELALYTYLLLLLAQCGLVGNVSVLYGLLPLGVETDNVV